VVTDVRTPSPTDQPYVGFEVFTAVVMKSIIFWDMTPCSLKRRLKLDGLHGVIPEDDTLIPPLTYSSETWTVTERQREWVEAAEMNKCDEVHITN
jgi:hypothetical protein